MKEQGIRNLKTIVNDISEGLVIVNPLFLKQFNEVGLKNLLKTINQKQIEVRSEPFPYNEIQKIRQRNMRLQRLHNALTIIKNYSKEKGIQLF